MAHEPESSSAEQVAVREFTRLLAPDVAIPVAAFHALTAVIKESQSSTMMELEVQLRAAADGLKGLESPRAGQTTISLQAGCELFLRYVTRCFLDFPNFDVCKEQLIERGERFAEMSLRSRNQIAEGGHTFVRDGGVVLTHACSRVVLSVLLRAARQLHFSVIVTEARPTHSGVEMARLLNEAGVPASTATDAAAAYCMERADMVLVGAEGVVENGGIVNAVGTLNLAMAAKALGKPFYVAAESYKFARMYPLTQRDLPASNERSEPPPGVEWPEGQAVVSPCCDFTPPEYITLLFTDLGVLTPSAVSDELIKLYQ